MKAIEYITCFAQVPYGEEYATVPEIVSTVPAEQSYTWYEMVVYSLLGLAILLALILLIALLVKLLIKVLRF